MKYFSSHFELLRDESAELLASDRSLFYSQINYRSKGKINMDQLIEQILQETDYLSNSYFVHLKDGTFDKNDFVETQIQFYSAVDFFARPMAALVSKIPCPEQRLGILRNVWEEHGEGDRERFHKFTFLDISPKIGWMHF